MLMSVLGKFCFNYRIRMVKAKQTFFSTSNLESYSNKATSLCLASEYHLLAVVSAKLCFLIGAVD